MSAINPASFVSPGAGVQLGANSGPLSSYRERERYTENRSSFEELGIGVTPLSEIPQASFTQTWNSSQDPSIASNIPHATYGHYFAAQPQAAQALSMQQPEFGRGLYGAFRPPSPLSFTQYGGLHGIQGPSQLNTQYGSQNTKNTYPEQVKAFQSLSLGS